MKAFHFTRLQCVSAVVQLCAALVVVITYAASLLQRELFFPISYQTLSLDATTGEWSIVPTLRTYVPPLALVLATAACSAAMSLTRAFGDTSNLRYLDLALSGALSLLLQLLLAGITDMVALIALTFLYGMSVFMMWYGENEARKNKTTAAIRTIAIGLVLLCVVWLPMLFILFNAVIEAIGHRGFLTFLIVGISCSVALQVVLLMSQICMVIRAPDIAGGQFVFDIGVLLQRLLFYALSFVAAALLGVTPVAEEKMINSWALFAAVLVVVVLPATLDLLVASATESRLPFKRFYQAMVVAPRRASSWFPFNSLFFMMAVAAWISTIAVMLLTAFATGNQDAWFTGAVFSMHGVALILVAPALISGQRLLLYFIAVAAILASCGTTIVTCFVAYKLTQVWAVVILLCLAILQSVFTCIFFIHFINRHNKFTSRSSYGAMGTVGDETSS